MLEIANLDSNLAIAIFAAIALYIGLRQVKDSREVSALSAYENYHILCLQYPKYSIGLQNFDELSEEEL